MRHTLLSTLAAIGSALFAATAQAAGSDTGVEAGVFAMGTDMTTLYQGAGGNLILIISLIVGVVLFAVTSRWIAMITPVAAGLFLGYGQNIATSLGGVSADIAMVEIVAVEALPEAAGVDIVAVEALPEAAAGPAAEG
jgi:hypothetical protein